MDISKRNSKMLKGVAILSMLMLHLFCRKENLPYMKYADLFVHPSYVESQGLTVLEAMALGIPCVVTKSLGPCEFIEDGVNGLLTEQSPESLTEKVLTILNDKELYRQIKENTKCPERFSPDRIIKQIKTMIDGEN